MKREKITIVHLAPTMIQLLNESGSKGGVSPANNGAASSLRYAFFGGDSLTKRDLSKFKSLFPSATCVNFYGATETPQAMGYFVIPQNGDTGVAGEITTEKIPLGRGIEGAQLLVLNDTEQLAGIGELGQIYVRTPYLAKGYLRNNALTEQRFIVNPFNKIPGDRLYKTGDSGRYLADGSVEYVGRTDHQVKIRGFRIELGEIETVLCQNPAIRQSVVLVREEIPDDKRLVAYVVSRQGEALATKDLRDFLKKKLPDYMVPSAFVIVDSLTLTPNGKIDRKALPIPDHNRTELEESYVAPRTRVEKLLAGIWADVLKIERVGIHDNFFDLGGHSLLALRLFAEIEKRFKKRLPLSSLFQRATIQHLASVISQPRSANGSSSLVAIQPHGSKPPFFCIHEFFGDVFCYMNLARHLGQDQPFYALQARGLDDEEEPFADIEAMAKYYIDTIRAVQPQGPYALGGLCFGGVVAFEMAQQLRINGESVSVVALLDSGIKAGSETRTRWWRRFEAVSKKLPSWFVGALELNGSQWLHLFKLKQSMVKAKFRSRNGNAKSLNLIDEMADLAGFSKQHRKVAYAQRQAMRNYRPKVYPGQLTLFRARMQPLFSPHKPDKGWGRLAAGGLDIRIVPGNHLGMLQEPHVRVLAEQLRACLDEANGFGEVSPSPQL